MPIVLDNGGEMVYNERREKAKPQWLCPFSYKLLSNRNRPGRGGYDAFTAKITDNAKIISIATSNFFAICSNMLILHKHSPFHRLGTLLYL